MLQVGDPAPEVGLKPVFGVLMSPGKGTLVVCFVRPLTGSSARTTIATLIEAYPRFDAEGYRMVIVSRSDLEFARDFVPRNHVLVPLVADSDGEITRQFGVVRDRAFLGTLKALRPSGVRSFVDSISLGRDAASLPATDLPAQFVFKGGKVAYANYHHSVLGQPNVEALWSAARG